MKQIICACASCEFDRKLVELCTRQDDYEKKLRSSLEMEECVTVFSSEFVTPEWRMSFH